MAQAWLKRREAELARQKLVEFAQWLISSEGEAVMPQTVSTTWRTSAPCYRSRGYEIDPRARRQ